MTLLVDIGNTNTHLGLADARRVLKQSNIRTSSWLEARASAQISKFIGRARLESGALCSVVPNATPLAIRALRKSFGIKALELTAATIRGIGINYPNPRSIGPDRLANAIAARRHYGAPALVVDFGTAVTFDVIDCQGDYAGGIIAPGLSAMTDYLHEKTALLPRIKVREISSVIGKSTEQAMLVGAVHGYRGLVSGLIRELKSELDVKKLPVIATGGYAKLISARMPEITKVDPLITLEGLRLFLGAYF